MPDPVQTIPRDTPTGLPPARICGRPSAHYRTSGYFFTRFGTMGVKGGRTSRRRPSTTVARQRPQWSLLALAIGLLLGAMLAMSLMLNWSVGKLYNSFQSAPVQPLVLTASLQSPEHGNE